MSSGNESDESAPRVSTGVALDANFHRYDSGVVVIGKNDRWKGLNDLLSGSLFNDDPDFGENVCCRENGTNGNNRSQTTQNPTPPLSVIAEEGDEYEDGSDGSSLFSPCSPGWPYSLGHDPSSSSSIFLDDAYPDTTSQQSEYCPPLDPNDTDRVKDGSLVLSSPLDSGSEAFDLEEVPDIRFGSMTVTYHMLMRPD
ncbi:hypothetical protein TREMEDRAFT_61620 [Tremella mesenterica DSM 1558]|uniref:uncharacterized protein n=1 Tax=Tremella mesenterica (strain ATCC 24925 / CBS 8224 / DSM 1558 / NBRC 9311 / NRRL Y-6157 / RJB 2259-6 / UBC 559-6) TaxID=578456 RepID=UPI0003F49029|nr:uncharacterized protein TREMEDRAFT_61620 [Tremella mesenterica DSM 1558]EIW69849.1 hypothetical protein TREMEDRAFT_61620 [Tremella mesenterica DSM 1558]